MTEAEARGSRERPLSPHLSAWRWHVTMATSIAHRVSGVGLYFGALIAAAWAVALASGPETYGDFKALLGSPLGKFVMFGLTVCALFHLANGIRHLVWDAGHSLDLKSANASSFAIFGFTAAATVAVWVIAALTGAL